MKKLLNLKKNIAECSSNKLDILCEPECMKDYQKFISIISKGGTKIACAIIKMINEERLIMYPYKDDLYLKDVKLSMVHDSIEDDKIQISIDFTDIDIEYINSQMELGIMNLMFFEITENYDIVRGLGGIWMPITHELIMFKLNSQMQITEGVKCMNITIGDDKIPLNDTQMKDYVIGIIEGSSENKLGYINVCDMKTLPDGKNNFNALPVDNKCTDSLLDYVNIVKPYLEEGDYRVDVIVNNPWTYRSNIENMIFVAIDAEHNISVFKDNVLDYSGFKPSLLTYTI